MKIIDFISLEELAENQVELEFKIKGKVVNSLKPDASGSMVCMVDAMNVMKKVYERQLYKVNCFLKNIDKWPESKNPLPKVGH